MCRAHLGLAGSVGPGLVHLQILQIAAVRSLDGASDVGRDIVDCDTEGTVRNSHASVVDADDQVLGLPGAVGALKQALTNEKREYTNQRTVLRSRD